MKTKIIVITYVYQTNWKFCQAGDDVWTGVSSDDKDTGEAARSSRIENAKYSLEVTN